MQIHSVKRNTKRATKKRVGRGGVRGKTSGRGHKGQKQHGGHGIRPEMRDLIKKIPKLRGHGKNRARTVNADKMRNVTVTLAQINEAFENGEKVTPKALVKKQVVARERGRAPFVKIVSTGELTKKVKVYKCTVTDPAKVVIEKAGGSVAG